MTALDEAGLVAALDADPSDAVARAILADALEEAGRATEAAGHRWMLRAGKWPRTVHYPSTHPWDWWRRTDWEYAETCHVLPPAVCDHLPWPASGDFIAYRSRDEAESALFAALLACGEVSP